MTSLFLCVNSDWRSLKQHFRNFSSGGQTTKSWLTSNIGANLAFDGNHTCEAYICGLGVNDAGRLGSNYLETISDIDINNYNNNIDSYYGNYGKIIQKIKEISPKAKIWLVTIPYSNSIYQNYNEAIRSFDNVYLED